nr:hypothetical protein BCU00_08340 [Vibrio breoganii]
MASEFLSEVKQGMRLRGYALKTETELSRVRSCLLPLITFGMSKLTKHHYLNFEAQLISAQNLVSDYRAEKVLDKSLLRSTEHTVFSDYFRYRKHG